MKKFHLLLNLVLLFTASLSSGADKSLHQNIKAAVSDASCNKITRCGHYVEVSCRPELDGALDYYNNISGERIMLCGGACEAPLRQLTDPKVCKSCPPAEWSLCEKKMRPPLPRD